MYSNDIEENGNTVEVFQQSSYISTLTVSGRLSGVYGYSATNRDMSTEIKSSFIIEGNAAAKIL